MIVQEIYKSYLLSILEYDARDVQHWRDSKVSLNEHAMTWLPKTTIKLMNRIRRKIISANNDDDWVYTRPAMYDVFHRESAIMPMQISNSSATEDIQKSSMTICRGFWEYRIDLIGDIVQRGHSISPAR